MNNIVIREYKPSDELRWLDVHASVMVDSYAWWTVIHKKPSYKNEVIDLVAVNDRGIIGFITIEINSDIMKDSNLDGEYGFVWEFGVYRDFRGNKIGEKLIKNAHEIMRNNFGINKSIWYSQDPKAQEYYERLGMKEIERHWQFSVYPTEAQKKMFIKDKFDCWTMRGSCAIDHFEEVKKKYSIIEDDDALKPRICIGYEYIL